MISFVGGGADDLPVPGNEKTRLRSEVRKDRRYILRRLEIELDFLLINMRSDFFHVTLSAIHKLKNEFGREVEPHQPVATIPVDLHAHPVACLQFMILSKDILDFGA